MKIGTICDRSGPTAYVTATLCDAVIGWLDSTNNATGGARGRPIAVQEIDAKYEVPLAVDAYKRLTTREGVRMMIPFGTPLIDALAASSKEDKQESGRHDRSPFQARETLRYARGLLMGNFLAEAARRADNPMDGDSLKKGIETIKDFTAHELLADLTLTPEDHGGTRKLRMCQVKDGKMVQIRDWFEGPLP